MELGMGHNIRSEPIPGPKIFSLGQSPTRAEACPLFPQQRTQMGRIASASENRHPRSAFPSGADVSGTGSECPKLTRNGLSSIVGEIYPLRQIICDVMPRRLRPNKDMALRFHAWIVVQCAERET